MAAPLGSTATAHEIELKLLLDDADAFERVRAALERVTLPQLHEQVNYYLDTVQFDLRRQAAMVRVRVANGRALVTCKTKATLVAGVQKALEREQPLPDDEAGRWLRSGQSRTSARALGIEAWLCEPIEAGGMLQTPLAAEAALHTLGALANTRRAYTLRREDLRPGAGPAQVVIELDHSRYSAPQASAAPSATGRALRADPAGKGAERFEIELEHGDAAELAADVHAFLAALDLEGTPATESKYAQFLRLTLASRAGDA